MKLRKVKKENGGPARTCFKGGFALLFSVLVSSLLLTIGLSILNISIKELAISTASKQYIYAFYAADSGLECAKYWDTKEGLIPNLIEGKNPGRTGGVVVCGGGSSQSLEINVPIIPHSTTLTPVNMLVSDGSSSANFDVTIEKKWQDVSHNQIITTVVSTGHNSDGGDRVERAIQQTY